MPVQSCSNNGKPGFKFGDSGMCYTYTAGNESSKKRAKAKARLQEIAARASGWTEKNSSEKQYPQEEKMEINFSYDDAQKIKKEHQSMAAWHQSMADSHQKVASWHESQSENLAKAMNEVPLDPDKSVRQVSPAKGSSAPAQSGRGPAAKEVPLDPMKKSELIQMILDYPEIFGSIGESLQTIYDIENGE
jgi:hypothetical protein